MQDYDDGDDDDVDAVSATPSLLWHLPTPLPLLLPSPCSICDKEPQSRATEPYAGYPF